jgi:hypothetical protein
MAELGQIEKPSVESFSEKRKLYCVPNIYPIKDAPDDYRGLVERYWNEVAQQMERLEAAGKAKKIFCESIFVQGEEAFDALEKLNEKVLQIVRKRVEEGAVFLPIEREDIFGPFIDWANCLNVVRTKEVFDKVYEFYTELSDRRLKYIQNIIETNLSIGEAGMLIMRDEDRVRLQFPSDIEVFLVTPPSYDDILRWFREKMNPKKS